MPRLLAHFNPDRLGTGDARGIPASRSKATTRNVPRERKESWFMPQVYAKARWGKVDGAGRTARNAGQQAKGLEHGRPARGRAGPSQPRGEPFILLRPAHGQ